LKIEQGVVFFGINVDITSFEQLALEHFNNEPSTLKIETLGSSLIDEDFPLAGTHHFVKEVCRWGNYSGIAGRIFEGNADTAIATALRDAVGILGNPQGNVSAALTRVNRLRSLGTPSFASKHLRFLDPCKCPVFDAVLRQFLPYSFGPDGYALFAADCVRLAKTLTQKRMPNPWREDGVWRAADAEAALWTWARGQTDQAGPA